MTARNPSVPVKRPVTAGRSSARPLGSSEPPETTTLAARTLGVLRTDILSLKLAPGSKLLLAGLCETYKVGLSPLREALSRLVVQGLVVGEDHRGFWVTPLTEEDFYDLTHKRRTFSDAGRESRIVPAAGIAVSSATITTSAAPTGTL